MGSPVAEAVGSCDHPAGAEQEAAAVMLALELHRCHVGTGVRGHLSAPNDPSRPGACRWDEGYVAGWGEQKMFNGDSLGTGWDGGQVKGESQR